MQRIYDLIEVNFKTEINNSKILFDNINLKDIKVFFDLSNSYFNGLTNEEIDFVENNWTEQSKKNVDNSNFFNGKLMQFLGIENNVFYFRKTDYKHFIATSKSEFLSICKNKNNIANPLTITGIIETNDNKVVIGTRRNNDKLWQAMGGMFDPDNDIIDNKMDFKNCIIRETKEELCNLNLYNFQFLGIVANRGKSFSTIVFSCKSKETCEYIKNNHMQEKVIDFWEMPKIDFIDIDLKNITKLVVGDENRRLVGTNLSSFILYGKHKFGNEWFKRYSKLLKN